VSLFLSAVAFLAIAFLVPQDYFNTANAGRLNIDEQADRLAEQIEALKQENIIDEEEAELLEEQLAQVRKEADAVDPIKTWEALDHLDEKLTRAAQQEANEALAQQPKMDEAQALAEALHEDQSSANPQMKDELLKQAMQHLGEQLKEMMKNSEWLKKALEEQGVDSNALAGDTGEAGELTPEQMEALSQLAAAIKGGRAGKVAGFKRLKEVRLIDAEMLAKLCEGGKCDKEGLIAYLCKACEGGNCSLKDAMAAAGRPGRGGITRGRGDAAMTWRDPASEEGAKFNEEVLPQTGLEALREATLIGVSTSAPDVVDPATASDAQSAALARAQAGGGSANKQTILPRHRQAVTKYFERN
jgi:hypothetical protein